MPGKKKAGPGLFIRSGKLYSKLFECNFWWNYLEFNNKMGLIMQIRISNNETHCHAICLKFKETSFIFLTMLGLEAKSSIRSTIKEK